MMPSASFELTFPFLKELLRERRFRGQNTTSRLDRVFNRGDKIDYTSVFHNLDFCTGFYVVSFPHISRYNNLPFRQCLYGRHNSNLHLKSYTCYSNCITFKKGCHAGELPAFLSFELLDWLFKDNP